LNLQTRQVKKHIEDTYSTSIDMSDCKNDNADKRAEKLTSRSLGALAINLLSSQDTEIAAKSITDGFRDYGIDAIHYEPSEKCLYLIQAKFSDKTDKSVNEGDIHKFLRGVNKIITANFDGFNDKIKSREKEITDHLMDPQNRFNLVVIHTSTQRIPTSCKELIDDFLDANNEISEQFFSTDINIKDVYKYISSGASSSPIDHDAALHNWSHIDAPLKAFYGQIAGSDLAQWYHDSGPHLFAPNIRVYLGNTEVNEGITETVRDEPEFFWYFNNGITALCSSIEKKPIGGNSRDTGYFTCKNIRIVNGAQTVGTLHSMSTKYSDQLSNTKVWIRLIEVDSENVTEEHEISRKITQTNNTQNRIEKRDFVSLDPEQKRIHEELAISNITYLYKAGETTPNDEVSFDLTQATIARACMQEDVQMAVQAKREISKLWEDIRKPPYKKLFNSGLKSENLLKEVDILKLVDKYIKDNKKELDTREALLITHGNRFLLHLVMRYIGDDVYSREVEYSEISDTCDLMFREMNTAIQEDYQNSYLASLFKNNSKCKDIKEKIKSSIELDL